MGDVSGKNQAEPRKYKRVKISRPTIVVLSSGSKVRAQLINISVGGAAFYYPAPADPGTQLKMCFQLPVKGELQEIVVKGVTCHSHLKQGGFVTGVEFDDLPEDIISKINAFIIYKEAHCASIAKFVANR